MTREPESSLVAKAAAGDRMATQQLLIHNAAALTRVVQCRLPLAVRDVVDAEDIVQQTFVESYRSIGNYQANGAPFLAWLTAIAENKIMDTVKALQRLKRGGDRNRIRHVATDSQSYVDLITLLSAGSHTPSRSVANHEAVAAVQQAITELPDAQQRAVQLRLIQGESLPRTAELMNCGPRAVQGLIDRAKKKLRANLQLLSIYT